MKVTDDLCIFYLHLDRAEWKKLVRNNDGIDAGASEILKWMWVFEDWGSLLWTVFQHGFLDQMAVEMDNQDLGFLKHSHVTTQLDWIHYGWLFPALAKESPQPLSFPDCGWHTTMKHLGPSLPNKSDLDFVLGKDLVGVIWNYIFDAKLVQQFTDHTLSYGEFVISILQQSIQQTI
jgi:hypothetical protein